MARRNRVTDVFRHVDMTGGPTACWPWTGGTNSKGRPYFSLNGRKELAYRLVYELVKGIALEGVGRHKCDNPVCCNPAHLEPGTHQQNMDDMKQRERHGMPHHAVKAIRKLADTGVTHSEIAKLYGIGRSTVTELVNGVNYGHVTEEGNENEGNAVHSAD